MACPVAFLGFVMARSRPRPSELGAQFSGQTVDAPPNLERFGESGRTPYRQILGQAVVEGLDEARFLLTR
jgi:hypothetical protein